MNGIIDTKMAWLAAAGVAGLTREGDVHVGEGMQVAWFKDPDGNILNIVSR